MYMSVCLNHAATLDFVVAESAAAVGSLTRGNLYLAPLEWIWSWSPPDWDEDPEASDSAPSELMGLVFSNSKAEYLAKIMKKEATYVRPTKFGYILAECRSATDA
ncbi:hypothetical protein HAX54_027391 [Datura stramonium]|uniref:Uncharacterized protein n=1 Tax=Datura stramonium TaxID=4076 RepID=A0ABS8V3Y8_DATST|nr:hypothetical protein [Datura stramonium]